MYKKYLAFIILFLSVISLNAQSNHSNLGEANQYNLFVIGNAQLSSADIQGVVAIGGNADITNFSIGDQIPNSSGTVNVLTV